MLSAALFGLYLGQKHRAKLRFDCIGICCLLFVVQWSLTFVRDLKDGCLNFYFSLMNELKEGRLEAAGFGKASCERSGQKASLIADDVYEIIMKHAAKLDREIVYERDFDYDYFGFKTLERSYLLKIEGKVVETPQHMLMRVAVGIHKDDIDLVFKTYHLMSQFQFVAFKMIIFFISK
ncbi:hypothetical protein M8C21_009896 [Ambrosia artemisiifolia]|uniref:Ribonucleotide reductase large subunit N-terminal domain-containing protein n=1 Tax=Ambrosia artemisiifolia TaxID=4212 RepID=A0AAD5BVL8_AMBAR|nr:hypothetical protein M8C21_009896 [Ambrosia artemisiifolia]